MYKILTLTPKNSCFFFFCLLSFCQSHLIRKLPWKKGFCLGFCSARGLVNRALLGCGMVSLAVVLVLSAPAGRLMAKIMRAIYG